jgi:hypothetical protein
MNAPVVLNSKVSPRVNHQSNILSAMDEIARATENLEKVNSRYRYTVMVGNKYAFRDTNSPKRYSLSDKPFYFYQESLARDCLRSLPGRPVFNAELMTNN